MQSNYLTTRYIRNMFYYMKKLNIECTSIAIENHDVYFEIDSNSYKILVYYDEVEYWEEDLRAVISGRNMKELLDKFKQSDFYKKGIRNRVWRYHDKNFE